MRHAISHLVAMELARANRTGARVLDLGSGWGGLARRLAAEHPEIPVVGVERALIPLLWSVLMQRLRGPANARFVYRDVLTPPAECGPAQAGPTVLVAYLAPDHMARLGRALLERTGPNETVLVSAAFALHGYEPDRVETLTDLYRTRVYLYRGL